MILLILFLFSASLIFLLLKSKKHEPLHLPPGPKGLPLIGNLHQFDTSNTHVYFAELAKTYGPILLLRFGCKHAVVVQSAEAAKEVLQRQDLNFCFRPTMVGTHKLTYNGLDLTFARNPDNFRELKKVCSVHLFNSKKVESLAPIRHEEVMRMMEKISTVSDGSKIVDLSELLLSYVSSNVCRTAFGNRYDDDEGSQKRCHKLLREAQDMFTAFFFADYIPSLGWLDKLTGQSSRLEKTFRDLDAFFDEIINDHLDPNRLETEQEDIVDVLLQTKKQRAFTFEITLDHVKAILLDMFSAGADTSAAMIVWAMTELVKQPTAMRKIQEELRNAARTNKDCISDDDLPNLEYFKAVIKETLRFHPAAPILVLRECVEKCTVEGYDILPKTLVFVNAWAIGRDPKCWNDPDKFMPERFLGNSIDYVGQDFKFIPFGAGRKMCPGMLLGVANFELALANLLYYFNWELPVGTKIEDIDTDTLPGITMHKKNPLCLVATKHSQLP